MKYLGIDYGARRVGIAVSDDGGRIALPRTVLKNTGDAAVISILAALIAEEGVGKVVVGVARLPERETAQTRKTLRFVEALRSAIRVPVAIENELLTTKIAEAAGKRNADAGAAALILQAYLDAAER